MSTQKFSEIEALRFGWNTMRNNIRFFIGLLIVAGLIYFALEIIDRFWGLFGKERPIFSIVDLIGIIFWMIIQLGLIKVSLNFCDNIQSKISDLFSQYRLLFRYLAATILYILIMLLGPILLIILELILNINILTSSISILLIIPWIYLTIRFYFYGYFIVDKKAGAIESLIGSWAATQGAFCNLFLLGLLLIGVNLLGALCFIIGLFATIPTTMVALAFVYRKLLAEIEST